MPDLSRHASFGAWWDGRGPPQRLCPARGGVQARHAAGAARRGQGAGTAWDSGATGPGRAQDGSGCADDTRMNRRAADPHAGVARARPTGHRTSCPPVNQIDPSCGSHVPKSGSPAAFGHRARTRRNLDHPVQRRALSEAIVAGARGAGCGRLLTASLTAASSRVVSVCAQDHFRRSDALVDDPLARSIVLIECAGHRRVRRSPPAAPRGRARLRRTFGRSAHYAVDQGKTLIAGRWVHSVADLGGPSRRPLPGAPPARSSA